MVYLLVNGAHVPDRPCGENSNVFLHIHHHCTAVALVSVGVSTSDMPMAASLCTRAWASTQQLFNSQKDVLTCVSCQGRQTSHRLHFCFKIDQAGGSQTGEGGRTFGAAGAIEGDLVGGGGGGGHPVLLAQLTQAIGPVGGEAVGHHICVGDPGRLQRRAHLCLGPEHQWHAGLTCTYMPAATPQDRWTWTAISALRRSNSDAMAWNSLSH